MASWRLLLTIVCSAGWICAIEKAAAQEPAVPAAAGAAANAAASSSFPWDDIVIEWSERRYKIEAIRFKARDETGPDWPGSDEVMVGTSDAKGWTVSDEIGNVDSGDTHDFEPAKSCIVAVSPGIVVLGRTSVCDGSGEAAPLRFEVEIWEKGWFGFPAGFCVPLSPAAGRHAGPHCVNDHNGDDFIGHTAVELPAQDLEAALPNIGDQLIETVVLSPCEGGGTCGGWGLPDYSFTYRVTRLPDVRTDFLSQLQAAMQRSGIPTATEAVASGLRALRAPVPRETVPESGDASPRE